MFEGNQVLNVLLRHRSFWLTLTKN